MCSSLVYRRVSNLAGPLVNTGQVDLRNESDFRGDIRIVGTAVDAHTVYAILMDAVRWAEDGSVPVGHEHVVALFQAVRASLCKLR
jgi:hypothetical protein